MGTSTFLHDFGDGKGEVLASEYINPDGSIGGIVADTALVDYSAHVNKHATVFGFAHVTDYAIIEHSAKVYGNAIIRGKAIVCDHAEVSGICLVQDKATVSDFSNLRGQCFLKEASTVCGDSKLVGQILLEGISYIKNSQLHGNMHFSGTSMIKNSILTKNMTGHNIEYYDVSILEDARTLSEEQLEAFWRYHRVLFKNIKNISS